MKNKRKKNEWYPLINYDKCISCLACVDKCTHRVYAIKDGKPKVANKNNCINNCRGCEPVCPVGAITHFSSEIEKASDKSCCKKDCKCGCN